MQKLKELIKLSNIIHQKLRNCWVAKKLMSRTSPVKIRVFRREFLRNHSMNWTQIFIENLNCYALSIFRVFILLASSDSDKHMLMRRSVNKDSPIRQKKTERARAAREIARKCMVKVQNNNNNREKEPRIHQIVSFSFATYIIKL